MNSFRLTAVGVLARNPELIAKGDIKCARFCLTGNDSAGETEKGGPREFVTSLWFVAFGKIAESIARHSRKGDQLILEARVIAAHWSNKQGERQHGTVYIVTGFRLGARRGEPGSPVTCRSAPPDRPIVDAALAAMEEVD